ncbi:uncharacterized protein LOC112574486 isoform X2 [Pomacea canaliculata]|uniref:uncharacterized protein LOC112574486 isoform X2 n=1 Tax=Pomacea canaliculata TaxID=400727 RepID=UPI000D73E327|nr:uncharacterized protein LOC112574486 isoform X2 [Pomacea canaliculata]
MGDSSDDEMLMLAAALHVLKKKKTERGWWIKPWLKRGAQQSAYNALMLELSAVDSDSYSNFVRMDPQNFQMLLARVGPYIIKRTTNMREYIAHGERLAVTLIFLATGDSYQSLCFLYRLGRSTIGEIIPDTCRAITAALKDQYLELGSQYNTKMGSHYKSL